MVPQPPAHFQARRLLKELQAVCSLSRLLLLLLLLLRAPSNSPELGLATILLLSLMYPPPCTPPPLLTASGMVTAVGLRQTPK